MNKDEQQLIFVSTVKQRMTCFKADELELTYLVSTAKNGVGEQINSECTPRGWHKCHSVIGLENQVNSVFVGRVWTGEIYSEELAKEFPERDWILTRIIRLEGLESGRNKGEGVDSFDRFIYIHGTPDSTRLGQPGSHGCIRMNNAQIMELSCWVTTNTLVYIE